MSRFDDLMNNLMSNDADAHRSEAEGQTLGELWERIRRMEPATALLAAPFLFMTAGIAVLGLLAAAIFGGAALVLLEAILGGRRPAGQTSHTFH